MTLAGYLAQTTARALRLSMVSRVSRFRDWPPRALLIDEPLALAEHKTNRLRRIYANALRDAWDGPTVFRDAVNAHGGIQLDRDKRVALSYPISMLMWGELAAWIVSAELAERLDDADARMAASSQVFDEARHFYTLRDYVSLLHVPTPPLDKFFTLAMRTLLDTRDLDVKLLAMQILAEGTAQSIFKFLAEAQIEPVLSELLPLIERDEARHVGLGIMHLPARLAKRTPRDRRRIARKVATIGDLFGATQLRYIEHYHALGLDPRDLFRRCDRMLHGLSETLGRVPGTDEPYFLTNDPSHPHYEAQLAFIVPPLGREPEPMARLFHRAIGAARHLLPA